MLVEHYFSFTFQILQPDPIWKISRSEEFPQVARTPRLDILTSHGVYSPCMVIFTLHRHIHLVWTFSPHMDIFSSCGVFIPHMGHFHLTWGISILCGAFSFYMAISNSHGVFSPYMAIFTSCGHSHLVGGTQVPGKRNSVPGKG